MLMTMAQTPQSIWYADVVLYRKGRTPNLARWAMSLFRTLELLPALPPGQLIASPVVTPGSTWHHDWPNDKHGLPCYEKTHNTVNVSSAILPPDANVIYYTIGKRRRKDRLHDNWIVAAIYGPQGATDALDRRLIDSTASISVNAEIDKAHFGTLRSLIEALIRTTAAFDHCMHGFVSLEGADSTTAGFLYSPHVVTPYDLDLQREEEAWWHSSTNREWQVRGAYWGNLFGPECVSRMKKQGVLEQFAALGNDDWDAPVELQGPFRNGAMFLTLSDNPLDAKGYRGSNTPFERRRLRMLSILKKHNFLPTANVVNFR